MIKNVVFDFGQVMVHFIPSDMVKKVVTDADDAKLLDEVVFDRLYWGRLDAGTITDDEVLFACKQRLPQRLWSAAETIYGNWMQNIPPIEGMAELVRQVKQGGLHVFLLSNISRAFAAFSPNVDCLQNFEKCIFSAVCGMVKPNLDIFAHLCAECNILPDETLFIDDSAKNIAGAEAFGIHGYLFDGDVKKLSDYLHTLF